MNINANQKLVLLPSHINAKKDDIIHIQRIEYFGQIVRSDKYRVALGSLVFWNKEKGKGGSRGEERLCSLVRSICLLVINMASWTLLNKECLRMTLLFVILSQYQYYIELCKQLSSNWFHYVRLQQTLTE